MKLTIIKDTLAKVWAIIKPLLKSKVLDILKDKNALALAEKTIEKLAKVDLDNDGKFDHATSELKAEFKEIGLSYTHSAISILVETVFQNLKSKGVVS